jgi:secreted PhoX family phosphatase
LIDMSDLSRRKLLMFFGISAGSTVLSPLVSKNLLGDKFSAIAAEVEPLKITPFATPSPLPIHKSTTSFLPTGIGTRTTISPSPNPQFSTYNIIDDLVVPPEYERYVILSWGDRIFPNPQEYFGYNNDYTAFTPISPNNLDDGYLHVNHEYISFPFSPLAPEAPVDVRTSLGTFAAVVGNEIGTTLPTKPRSSDRNDNSRRLLDGEFLYNLGVSFVRIKRSANGRFIAVKTDPLNRRVHGLSGLGINSTRTDGYQNVTTWGTNSYQVGDQNYLEGTGAAATDVFSLSSDGLGNKIIGTAYNCSGGQTPWGTTLSCEENFQGAVGDFMGVTEAVKPNGTQTGYIMAKDTEAGTVGETFGLVGEKYGWVVEFDPKNPNFRPQKHTALGRFRHENVALRVEAGKKLIAYMGDDRRGGHTWKYVSNGVIKSVTDPNNSKLFTDGKLYAARFSPNGSGTWIELNLSTPTNPLSPAVLSSEEFKALGSAQRDGLLPLPRRKGIAEQTTDGGIFRLTRTNEAADIGAYQGKTLATFYTSTGAILVDAFLAANLVGATPTARPEDLEVNPRNPREVFIAYTDGAPGGDGYPDSRIFQVAKYNADVNAMQQSGGLYKITETSNDSSGTSFTWQKLHQGGEAGANGSGFAALDNLAFDPLGNIWGVTDMSTSTHNGFAVGAAGTPNKINHSATGNVSTLTGVFGNNWLFYIPTSGENAGQVMPFAQGPNRSEMTGPTFVGNTLIISVQHPCEDCPVDDGTMLERDLELLALDGTLFTQKRRVARGSKFPANIPTFYGGKTDGQPRPSVVGIRRISGSRFI